MTNNDKIANNRREEFFKFENSLGKDVSIDELKILINFYIIASNYNDRDIMDSITFYIQDYGNRDLLDYMEKIIFYSNDESVNYDVKYLISIIV